MLYVLTDAALPPPLLVAAGRQLFERCKDPRVLPPLLPGLDKAAAAGLLPALLELPSEAFRAAAAKLVTPQPPTPPAAQQQQPGQAPPPRQQPPLFQPSELLVALHTLGGGSGGGDQGLLRRMMAGITVCLNSRWVDECVGVEWEWLPAARPAGIVTLDMSMRQQAICMLLPLPRLTAVALLPARPGPQGAVWARGAGGGHQPAADARATAAAVHAHGDPEPGHAGPRAAALCGLHPGTAGGAPDLERAGERGWGPVVACQGVIVSVSCTLGQQLGNLADCSGVLLAMSCAARWGLSLLTAPPSPLAAALPFVLLQMQWRGWVLCAERAAPESFPAWLQLPAGELGKVLPGTSERFRRQLAAYALGPQCTLSLPRATLEIMQQVEAGAAAAGGPAAAAGAAGAGS